MSRNLQWLNAPTDWISTVKPILPRVPRKWRVQVDCKGFNPRSIKCNVTDDHKQLVITAHEGDETKRNAPNYTLKEF